MSENNHFERFLKASMADTPADVSKTVSDLSLPHVRVLNYRKEFVKNNSTSSVYLRQNHASQLSRKWHGKYWFLAIFEGVDLGEAKWYCKTVLDLSSECPRLLNYTKELFKSNCASAIHLHQNHASELSQKNGGNRENSSRIDFSKVVSKSSVHDSTF